jgi:hypothetical protein
MEASKEAAVAGERKAATSIRSRAGEKSAAGLKALIRKPEKTVYGEQRGEASGTLVCNVQYRACRLEIVKREANGSSVHIYLIQ